MLGFEVSNKQLQLQTRQEKNTKKTTRKLKEKTCFKKRVLNPFSIPLKKQKLAAPAAVVEAQFAEIFEI